MCAGNHPHCSIVQQERIVARADPSRGERMPEDGREPHLLGGVARACVLHGAQPWPKSRFWGPSDDTPAAEPQEPLAIVLGDSVGMGNGYGPRAPYAVRSPVCRASSYLLPFCPVPQATCRDTSFATQHGRSRSPLQTQCTLNAMRLRSLALSPPPPPPTLVPPGAQLPLPRCARRRARWVN